MKKLTKIRRRPRMGTIFDLKYAAEHNWKADKLLAIVSRVVTIGQIMPIAVNKDNVILDGNDLAYVMDLLRLKNVLIIDADGLSPKEVRALRIRHNLLARSEDFWPETRLQLD